VEQSSLRMLSFTMRYAKVRYAVILMLLQVGANDPRAWLHMENSIAQGNNPAYSCGYTQTAFRSYRTLIGNLTLLTKRKSPWQALQADGDSTIPPFPGKYDRQRSEQELGCEQASKQADWGCKNLVGIPRPATVAGES
jgi:hypothetical protein